MRGVNVLIAPDTVEIASRLRLSVTRLARKLRQEGERGITPSQLSCLSTIEHHAPVSIGELSAHEQVQPPTTTKIVAALVEAGFVAREADPKDRRVVWLRPTPAGVRLLQQSRKRKEAFLAKRLRRLDARELAVIEEAANILDRLVEGEAR